MARNYYLSWSLGPDRRPRPRPDRRTLVRLGLILLALLFLLLLVLLVFLGHEARTGGNSSGLGQAALPVHAAYAFVFPDFVPGASAPGLPDLFRGTWDFLWGCSVIIRLLVLGALPLATAIAYRRGLRRGREEE
ncbi:MAG: hypothetical protein OXF79_22140 [Chloroflexi bacterium]|nr:hypothetical protein [Chloroflexota bacterium]